VPFALLLWRSRATLDQRRWLNLSRLGYVVDWIGLIWMAWVCVWTSFPLYIPVTATSMNYASAVFGVVVCISAVFYVFSYKHRLDRFERRPRGRFSWGTCCRFPAVSVIRVSGIEVVMELEPRFMELCLSFAVTSFNCIELIAI
jgi:hypothetical protein